MSCTLYRSVVSIPVRVFTVKTIANNKYFVKHVFISFHFLTSFIIHRRRRDVDSQNSSRLQNHSMLSQAYASLGYLNKLQSLLAS